MRTTLRNVRTGAQLDRTFRAGEKVEQAVIDKREMQYLYRDADGLVFMDNTSYDQVTVPEASLGDAANYLIEGATAILQFFGTEIVGTELPAAVEPARHRDRARCAGRPCVGRSQASHDGDRARSAGAAVRERGRPTQDRHPIG